VPEARATRPFRHALFQQEQGEVIMTHTAVAATGNAPAAIAAQDRPLRIVRTAGYAILAAQFACFAVWSTVLYRRFAVGFDYATNYQAWYLVAHGDLDPFNSTQGYPFWHGHAEFIMWPLALFYWAWPNSPMLLWLQDAAVVLAEAVAFTWGCELARKYRPAGLDAAWLAGAGLVLLIANPWTWWAISFDFHTECVSALFLVLLARDLQAGRRRAWAWVLPALACGDVAAAYTAAIGVSALLAAMAGRRSRPRPGRRRWLPGLALVGAGLAALALIRAAHAEQSSPLSAYAYLESPPGPGFSLVGLARGIAGNPGHVARVFWNKRGDSFRNVGSGGLIGAAFTWVLPLALVVLVTNDLTYGGTFPAPGFQSIALYIFVPAGTVASLAWICRRSRVIAMALAAVLLADALFWASQVAPQVKPYWLHTPAQAAVTLDAVLPRIPASDEVLASYNLTGRFAGREDVRALSGHGDASLDGSTTWLVLSPSQGTQTMTAGETAQLITQMKGRYRARLVAQGNGVWAFRWTPPRGMRTLPVP
jgi:hypothetical protein